MTALIAGSIVFIAVSAVSLGFGWLGARSELIWVSIAASATSGSVPDAGLLPQPGRRPGDGPDCGSRPGARAAGPASSRRGSSERALRAGFPHGARMTHPASSILLDFLNRLLRTFAYVIPGRPGEYWA